MSIASTSPSGQSTGPVSVSNFPSTQAVSGPLTDAQMRATPMAMTLSGSQTINPVDAQSAGNLSIVGQTVEVTLNGFGSCSMDFRSSMVPVFAGTILFEARTDASNWEPIIGYLTGSDGERYTQINETMCNNSFRFSVAGLQAIRARLTTLTLGNVGVTVRASAPTSAVLVNSPVAVLVTRRDADTTTALDGATHRLFTDNQGRLKVTTRGGVNPTTQVARTLVCITFTATNAAAADTLLTVSINRGGTVTSGTTVAVSSGKTMRLTGAVLSLRTTTAATPWGLLNIRLNPTGAAVITSPVIVPVGVSGTAAVIGNTGFSNPCIDDGLEFAGANQLGFSFSNNVATNVTNFSVYGYEYTTPA